MTIEVRFYIGEHATLGPFLVDRTLVLGRSAEADLPLADDGLSRRHCQIEPREGGILLKDLQSTNGVYYAGQRVVEVFVACGNEFWLGHTRALVAIAGVAAAPLPPKGQAPVPPGGPTPPPRQAVTGPALFGAGGTGPLRTQPQLYEAPAGAVPGTAPLPIATNPSPGSGARLPSGERRVIARTVNVMAVPQDLGAPNPGGAQALVQPQPAPLPPTSPTAMPAPAAASPRTGPLQTEGAVAPQAGPVIRVFVGGEHRTVKSVEFHFAENAGQQFVQLIVGYDEPGQAVPASVSGWIALS